MIAKISIKTKTKSSIKIKISSIIKNIKRDNNDYISIKYLLEFLSN